LEKKYRNHDKNVHKGASRPQKKLRAVLEAVIRVFNVEKNPTTNFEEEALLEN